MSTSTFLRTLPNSCHARTPLLTQAHREAESAGLGALDALHVAAAKLGGAEEFVTTERLGTALFRVIGLKMTTIRPTR